jgi:hypothetical protein
LPVLKMNGNGVKGSKAQSREARDSFVWAHWPLSL